MPIINMHPYLHDVFRDYETQYGKTCLSVNKFSDAEDLIVNTVSDNLSFQKPTLIVVGERQDSAWIAKVLSKYGLSKYCLVWTPEYIKQQRPITRIKMFSSASNEEFDLDRHRVLRNELEDIRCIIKERLSFLSTEVISGYTWYELLKKWSLIASKKEDDEFQISPEWSSFNYAQYLYNLGEAESGYKSEYGLLHNLSPFHPDVYSQLFDPESLGDELNARREELLQIATLFKQHFKKVEEGTSKGLYNEISKIADKAQRLDLHLVRLKARTKHVDQSKCFSKLCSVMEYHSIESLLEDLEGGLNECTFFDTPWLIKPTIKWSVSEFEELIESIKGEVDYLKKNVSSKIEERLRRLGPYNVNGDGVKLLDENLKTFVKDLNTSDLFEDKFENNALNFQNKILLIRKIQKLISQGIVFLETHPDYFDWRSALQRDQSNLILNELAFSSENWKSAIGTILLNQALRINFDPQILSVSRDRNELMMKQNEYYESMLGYTHSKINELRKEEIDNCKKHDKYTFQKIISDSEGSASVFNLFTKNTALFSAFFPVLVMKQKDYEEILPHMKDSNWNEIITLDCSLKSELQNILAIQTKGNAVDAGSFEFSIESHRNLKHLKSIALTQRYEDAVRVARLIMSLADVVSVYQMKNVSIISCLSDELEDMMSRQFIPQGIKCLHRNTNSIEGVTEAIIDEEAEFFLWIENGFIGDMDVDHIVWHQSTIEALQKIGIRVINVDFGSLFTEKNMVLKSIKQPVLGVGAPKISEVFYAKN